MSRSTTPQHPIGDGDELVVHNNDQQWIVTWHGPASAPDGKPHGSAGICVTPQGSIVIISHDGIRWDLPAGRSEGDEGWEDTLRRELREEACAEVKAARLLGFSRGRCIHGHERGLVLVRALWRADVELEVWRPRFEVQHRRVVSVSELLSHLTAPEGHLRIYQRALVEANLA